MRRSGLGSLLALPLDLAGCLYGFAGGGFPAHIRTIAILPFENETPAPELQREIYQAVQQGMRSRLGLRDAPEASADAVVRGTIVRYDVDVPVGYSADPSQVATARRKLQISIDISVVDQTNGRTLWERKNLMAEADYAERAETDGRRKAIEKLVNDIVEGAQSQW